MSPWKGQKYIPPKGVKSLVERLREQGKTIVTLNGSFDLLHAGHLSMIEEASKQGEILIIALNSDASIQAYKDPSRPIIPLEQRVALIEALQSVDYVTSFDELNPIHLLEIIKPDVHVNGEEYGMACIESATVESNGGRIHLVRRIPGLSTSNIIEKIRSCV